MNSPNTKIKKTRKKKVKINSDKANSRKQVNESEDEETLLNQCIAENAKLLVQYEEKLDAEVDRVVDVFNVRNEFIRDQSAKKQYGTNFYLYLKSTNVKEEAVDRLLLRQCLDEY